MCLLQLWRIMFLLADKTEDLSPGDSISDSSERHLLRGKGGPRVLFNKDQVVGTSKECCCCGGGCSVAKSCPTLCEPWTATPQASLSFNIFQNFLRFTSIESVMPSNHLIFCHPLLLTSIFPNSRVFPVSWKFISGGQNIGASASKEYCSLKKTGHL